MSGRWDWDVKSSYTYHALKKAKDVVEKAGHLHVGGRRRSAGCPDGPCL